MRQSTRSRAHICTPCLFARGRTASTDAFPTLGSNPPTPPPIPVAHNLQGWSKNTSFKDSATADTPKSRTVRDGEDITGKKNHRLGRLDAKPTLSSVPSQRQEKDGIILSTEQLKELRNLNRLRKRFQSGMLQLSEKNRETSASSSLGEALKVLQQQEGFSGRMSRLIPKLEELYDGQEFSNVMGDLEILSQHSTKSGRMVTDPRTKKLLGEFGLLHTAEGVDVTIRELREPRRSSGGRAQRNAARIRVFETVAHIRAGRIRKVFRLVTNSPLRIRRIASSGRRMSPISGRPAHLQQVLNPRPSSHSRRTLGRMRLVRHSLSGDPTDRTQAKDTEPATPKSNDIESIGEFRPLLSRKKPHSTVFDLAQLKTLEAQKINMQAVAVESPKVPGLSFDLSRVLFNPGIYNLQDPRSGVYNFDPYLQKVMPVSEFDFDSLSEYVTSSEDEILHQIAIDNSKKYIGSSSSMTGALVQFHFLISQWRQLDLSNLSRSFSDRLATFTSFQRLPVAFFLRHRNGIYAVDADKEFDSANILMDLGRSMEKLFTLPKEQYERFRKTGELEIKEKSPPEREAFHYSEQGDFLMRSQLDAHDPRLPGTGMFDLKTRAVAAVRMNVHKPEEGVGYQIKTRFGNWESYEREYYDMMRSAFLKYSLQVRMGRMDGIFVAYHNIERIFGFQYVSLAELDLHLHGQEGRDLGDQEFKLSVNFLNEIFDRATKQFPGHSIRFHIETREGTKTDPTPFMYIFGEPVDEEAITRIQRSRKALIEEYKKKILAAPMSVSSMPGTTLESALEDKSPEKSTLDTVMSVSSEPDTTRVDVHPLEESKPSPDSDLTGPAQDDLPLLALKLCIRNRVNNKEVLRPMDLDHNDEWTVEYVMTELEQRSAWKLYRACQNRRKNGQSSFDTMNSSANVYLRKLKSMSAQGAVWRKNQDQAAAQREVVTLYPEKPA